MADVNLQENLFQAIDTIVQARLANLPYDKTIECEIIDDSRSSIGTYTVKYQTVTFETSSNLIGLSKGDIVYVSIPQNDFTKEKILIAKKPRVQPREVKLLPFLSFIHGNNLLSQYQHDRQLTMQTNSGVENVNITTITNFEGESIAVGYNRLGLRMTINSAITSSIKSGDYGIKIILYGYDQTASALPSEDLITLAKESMSSELYYKELYLKIEDMITVNPYNTNGFQNQEKVFDITGWVIDTITISLWQDNNFYDAKGLPIKNQNLLITNLELYLGYDTEDFGNNTTKLFLYTPDGLLYNNQYKTKNIYTRFLKINDKDSSIFEDFSPNINPDNLRHNYIWEQFNSENTATSTISGQVGFDTFLADDTIVANSYTAELNNSELKNGYILLYEDRTKLPIFHFLSNTLWFVNEDFQELISDLMKSSFHEMTLEEQVNNLEKEYKTRIDNLNPSDYTTHTEYINTVNSLQEELKSELEDLQERQAETEIKGTMSIKGKEIIFKTEDGVIVLRLNTNNSQLVGNASTASGYMKDGQIYQNFKAIEAALDGSYTVI